MPGELLTRRWLIGHVIVLGLVVLFVRLGFWQLDRLVERRGHNALIEQNVEAAPVPIDDVVGEFSSPDQVPADAQYRRVLVSGVFDPEGEVLLRSRTWNGIVGFHAVTPLVTADGRAVLVNRGWVTMGDDIPPVEAAAPVAGSVTVEGLLRFSESRGRFGPTDPAQGVLEQLNRVDIPRLSKQLPYELYPVYVQLMAQSPPLSQELPRRLDPPVADEGPHLAYAIQWFAFALIALMGYPALLRKNVREGREGAGASSADEDGQVLDDGSRI